MDEKTVARFWSHVDKLGPRTENADGCCWVWKSARSQDGYGSFQFNRRAHRAHRLSWQLANGVIPAGMLVLHRCDRPTCVRPDHLLIGTPADNSKDMTTKGRAAGGARNSHAKLTAEQVAEIRAAYRPCVRVGKKKCDTGCAVLARAYGVRNSTIRCIVTRKTWAV